MSNPKDQKGSIAITFVTVTILSLALAGLAYFSAVNAKINASREYTDRIMAYYLCQTGISRDMIDLGADTVPAGGRLIFDYNVDGKIYQITYQLTKSSGRYNVSGEVSSPLGLNRTYVLRTAGQRAFPVFIKGFGAGI